MSAGYLSIILHAHLPYVRHPGHEGELAEEWFYEAITETYIPLLNIMEDLNREGVKYRITINLSPPLIAMLADELLQQRYQNRLENLIELGEKELKRTEDNQEVHQLAEMYLYFLRESHYIFTKKYENNLLQGFKGLAESDSLELITSAATHAYLPLLKTKEAVRAQINTGIKTFIHYLDRKPAGFWLPECGQNKMVMDVLAEEGVKYIISSSHGLLHAVPRPRYGLHAPVYTPAGVAVFGRDRESSHQVWSADEGYPGDYNYREFYRDIGHELDYDYIKPHLPGGIRKHTGFKYYKITGKTENKKIYDRIKAENKAAEHAGNFLFNRQHQIRYLSQIMDRKPLIVSPYDAELFGHWWFEGPVWLKYFIKKTYYDQDELQLITPGDYLKEYETNQIAEPAESSWGYRGYHEVWLNGSNDWIYRHLHQAESIMCEKADYYHDLTQPFSSEERCLNQMARELLLAQSSDWAFIMKTNTMVEYAVMRTRKHLHNFFRLAENISENLNEDLLKELENKNNIFPFLDYRIFSQKNTAHNRAVLSGREV